MIHQFFKYSVNLDFYPCSQEIPQEIIPYEKRLEGSLLTEIKRFQNELHWNEMWTIPEVYSRLEQGYKFWVLKPKNQIKGWTWLAPDGEIKNVYVSKWLRKQGWGKKLVECCCQSALDQEFSQIYARVDIWNRASIYLFEDLLKHAGQAGCKTYVKLVEEEYGKSK